MLDRRLKERLVGAIVLVLMAVIFIPMFLESEEDRAANITETNIPTRPETEFNSRLVPIPDATEQTVERDTNEPALETAPELPSREVTDITPVVEEQPPAVPVVPPAQKTTEPATEQLAADIPQLDKGMAAWVIQVGSFSNRENAEKLNKKLRENDYRSFVQPVENDTGTKVYKVRVGPEILRSDAKKLKEKLEQKMSLTGIIMSYP